MNFLLEFLNNFDFWITVSKIIPKFWWPVWKSVRVESKEYLSKTDFFSKLLVDPFTQLNTPHWGHATTNVWMVRIIKKMRIWNKCIGALRIYRIRDKVCSYVFVITIAVVKNNWCVFMMIDAPTIAKIKPLFCYQIYFWYIFKSSSLLSS